MNSIQIKLDNIKKLKQFVADCSLIDAKIEVVSGDAIADAKSIMGLMMLDLMKPLELRVHADDGCGARILEQLCEYRYDAAQA